MPKISLQYLANPSVFVMLANRLLKPLAIATLLAFAIGLYLAFFVAPDDYQQGSAVKIMYVHVPSAWIALFSYIVMTVASLGLLVWRHPLAGVAAKAAAPLGAAFSFICLTTGSIWGKPMWGTWWVWDARLTSMLILFIIYLGLITLWRAIEEQNLAAKATAIMTLVCFAIIPIIKFSVDWWNTLHQPASVFTSDGPRMATSMLIPLLVMALAFMLLFATLHLKIMKNEIMRRRIQRLQTKASPKAASGTVVRTSTSHSDLTQS